MAKVLSLPIQTPHALRNRQSEHVIVNLSHGGKLTCRSRLKTVRGYVPGNQRRYAMSRRSRLVASFSMLPSRSSVSAYTVESARVGAH
jgi:DNA-directed RNA polymerase subunit alpha